MDAAAAGAASATADAPAVVEEYALSDDSLTVSPEQPKRARTKSPDDFASPRSSRSPSTARSAHRKGPSLAAARVSSKFRAASAPRGSGRPPSPTPLRATLRDHRLVEKAESNDVEQRLAALERQQQDDHGFLAEMTVAVRGLLAGYDAGVKEQTSIKRHLEMFPQIDVNLRRELASTKGQLDSDLLMIKGTFETKLRDMENIINEIQVGMTNLHGREGQIAEYLDTLQGARPQEGQAIQASFEYLHTQINDAKQRIEGLEHGTTSVKDRVYNIEGRAHAPPSSPSRCARPW